MKQLLITIAAVLVVGCGESQQSTPTPEAKPVEPVAEAASPKPPKSKPLTPKRLLKAAKLDDIELVKEHLAAGVDVNTKDKVGWSPLRYAATFGHKEIAELLISSGADVNTIDEEGTTPLHKAAMMNHWEIIKLLIANGADVNAIVKSGIFKGDTPLDRSYDRTADFLRKHGGKTGAELKAEGK
jgi:ankyrin repeat protein